MNIYRYMTPILCRLSAIQYTKATCVGPVCACLCVLWWCLCDVHPNNITPFCSWGGLNFPVSLFSPAPESLLSDIPRQ